MPTLNINDVKSSLSFLMSSMVDSGRQAMREMFGMPKSTWLSQTERFESFFSQLSADDSAVHNFKEKFKEYAAFRLEMAQQPGSRDTVHGVSGYKSYYDKFIVPFFPDVYLDQVDGPTLEKFVKNLKDVEVPHKTNKNIIQHIHTFLRWCLYKNYHNEFGSALNWKIGKHGSSYLLPDNDDELYEKQTEVLTNTEANTILSYVERHRERSRDDAMAYGVFTMLACFGLRSSEIRGLKKTSFDFENNTVSIKGAFHARTGYVNKTKNRGSRRVLNFTAAQAKHIKWFADYMFEKRPFNKYFFSLPLKFGTCKGMTSFVL